MKRLTGVVSGGDHKILAHFMLVNKNDNETVLDLKPGSYSADDIKIGMPVYIKFSKLLNIPYVYTGVVSSLACDKNRLFVSSTRKDNFEGKRADVRVVVNMQVYIIRTCTDVLSEGAPLRQKIYVNLNDLSAGGICFTSRSDFPIEDSYELAFDRAREPIVVKFCILKKDSEVPGLFTYKCRFVDIFDAEERIIREFVFKKQLGNAWK